MKTAVSSNKVFQHSPKGGACGFAILTVVFVIVSFAVLGVAAVSMIAGSSRMVIDDYQSAQAFYVAEGGVAYVAEQLIADGDWSDNAGYTKAFGPGAFTVSFPNQANDTVTLEVSGTVGGITRRVQQQLTAVGFAAFDDGMYTAMDVVVGGSSSGTVTGSVSAGGTVNESGGVLFTGDIEENNSSAAVPTPDWAYWQGIADHVITGNYSFSPGTYNGVYYVTGDVTINQDVILDGSIITRSSMSCAGNGNVHITAGTGMPAIVAQGSISFSGTTDLSIIGWIFSLSTVTFTGNSDVVAEGGVTAGGTITMTGNTDVGITFNGLLAPAAGFDGGERGGISLGAWRETY